MSHQSDLIAVDIDAYLAQHERKDLLRFLTCGSVDDGKSTLIGRLLHDTKLVYEDQLAAVRADTARYGTTGDEPDLALLVDGLQAEREQGITIDVAYRYFSTAKRKFIIADTPGHEQYTRNMATGASTCDLAIILIDARNGVRTQTRRHSFIASLLGIRHIVVAVNKMDLVGYSEEVFERIKADYADFADRLEPADIQFVPLSALKGDNVVHPSANMPWYTGTTLMVLLENVHVASDRNLTDLRFPIQYVNRPDPNFRGYAGTVASGVIRKGDEVVVLPSRKTNRVKSIVTFEGEIEEAFASMAVTLTLEKEVDISRGDMLVHPDNLPHVAGTLEAMVVWMAEEPLRRGKHYFLKHASKLLNASVSELRYRVDVNTLKQEPADRLRLNEIGRCGIDLAQPAAFDPYKTNRATGAFILIDRLTHNTVGAGMILEAGGAGRRQGRVSSKERAGRFGQKPATLLLPGMPLARALERRLFDQGRAVSVIDAGKDPRRAAEKAKALGEAGLIVLVAGKTDAMRKLLGKGRAIEVEAAGLDEIVALLVRRGIIR